MKSKSDVFLQDGQLIIAHSVNPESVMRDAARMRQAQANKRLKDIAHSVAKIPYPVLYGFAKEKFGLSPNEAFRLAGRHNVLMALINDRDYSKFLTHDKGRDLFNQSFGEGES